MNQRAIYGERKAFMKLLYCLGISTSDRQSHTFKLQRKYHGLNLVAKMNLFGFMSQRSCR